MARPRQGRPARNVSYVREGWALAQATIESPVTASAPASRPRPEFWLLAAASVFAASELLPWQRTCIPAFGPHSGACFTVHGWQGNAAILGMVAAVAALAILVIFLKRQRDGGRLGRSPIDWALISVFLASASLKWILTVGAASTFGCWLGGAALAASLISGLEMVRSAIRDPDTDSDSDHRSLRRPIVVAVAAPLVLIIGLAIPYQVTGLARWGGPLAVGYFSEGGGASESLVIPTGRNVQISGVTWIRNGSRLPANLDALELFDVSPGVHFVGAYLIRQPVTEHCLVQVEGQAAVRLDHPCLRPLASAVLPRKPSRAWDLAILPVIRVERPGSYTIRGFFVRYSVGPFHYRVYIQGSVAVCAGQAGELPTAYRSCR
jgi:hypothetical protein